MAPTIISRVVVPAETQFTGGEPLDLISLADVKQELGVTSNIDDAWLAKVITRASRTISQACTRVFAPQTYYEYFQALRDPYPWQLPSGFFPLQLSAWPICSPPSAAGIAPPLKPTLSFTPGGSLGAATYYVRVSFVSAAGETAASQEANITVAANNYLVVSAPKSNTINPDLTENATGWNCYIGTSSFQETLQNSSPLSLNQNFTQSGALIAGAAVPPYILVVENDPIDPFPLAEGIDFVSDFDGVGSTLGSPDFSVGWLTRLFLTDETPRRWSGLPITVIYQAGYADIPDDLQDAALQLVKARWYARNRDPLMRSENIVGAYEAAWFFDTGPGSNGQFPPSITAVVDRYRVPTLA